MHTFKPSVSKTIVSAELARFSYYGCIVHRLVTYTFYVILSCNVLVHACRVNLL